MGEPACSTDFTDVMTRHVYEEGDRQFVFDNDGRRDYGVWFIPREECDTPIVVGDDLPENW
jgi:hypothetical protein